MTVLPPSCSRVSASGGHLGATVGRRPVARWHVRKQVPKRMEGMACDNRVVLVHDDRRACFYAADDGAPVRTVQLGHRKDPYAIHLFDGTCFYTDEQGRLCHFMIEDGEPAPLRIGGRIFKAQRLTWSGDCLLAPGASKIGVVGRDGSTSTWSPPGRGYLLTDHDDGADSALTAEPHKAGKTVRAHAPATGKVRWEWRAEGDVTVLSVGYEPEAGIHVVLCIPAIMSTVEEQRLVGIRNGETAWEEVLPNSRLLRIQANHRTAVWLRDDGLYGYALRDGKRLWRKETAATQVHFNTLFVLDNAVLVPEPDPKLDRKLRRRYVAYADRTGRAMADVALYARLFLTGCGKRLYAGSPGEVVEAIA